MFGDIGKSFGANFFAGYVIPVAVAVFFHRFLLGLGGGAMPAWDTLGKQWEAYATAAESVKLAGLVLCLAVLLRAFAVSITKAYEGYCRLPMAVVGAIAATGAGVVMYVWPDAGADAMWPLTGGSLLLLAALGQTVSETWHRKYHSRSWKAVGQMPDEKPRRDREFDLLRRYPRTPNGLRETKLGNVLRAFEYHPFELYQMDPLSTWPRLTPFLPKTLQSQIESAETAFDLMLNLSFVATLLAWESLCLFLRTGYEAFITAAVICAAVAFMVYLAACSQGRQWGEWVRAAFDLYRHDLLKQSGIDLPKEPITLERERELWRDLQEVTYYMDRDAPIRLLPAAWKEAGNGKAKQAAADEPSAPEDDRADEIPPPSSPGPADALAPWSKAVVAAALGGAAMWLVVKAHGLRRPASPAAPG